MALSVLISAWLVGAMGALHCLAMCGGFVAAMSGAGKSLKSQGSPLLPAGALARRALPYNLGRMTTYIGLGAIAGGAGGAALFASDLFAVQRALFVVANIFLLVLAWAIASDGKGVAWLQSVGAAVFARVLPAVRPLLARDDVLARYALGTLWGLVPCGLVYAVLDITTTEWADEIAGGILSAGPTRLEAPGKAGIPHLIVPGCIDMVNFGPPETVPEKYRGRKFYRSKPTTTLMRTTVEENILMGEIFAQKANSAKGKLAFLFPLKGFSMLDAEGQPFWWPEADAAFMTVLKKNLRPGIPVVEMDCHINDEAFAQKAVEMLLGLAGKR